MQDEKILQLRQKYGITPITQSNQVNQTTETPEQRLAFLKGNKDLTQNDTNLSFSERLRQDFEQRQANVSQAKGRVEAGKQTLAEGILQSTGQVAGLASDVLTEGIRSLPGYNTPSEFSPGSQYKTGLKDVATSAYAKYEEWAKQHPRAAANLEATINIASILPVGVATEGVTTAGKAGIQATKEVVATGLEKTAIRQAEKGIAKESSDLIKIKDLITPKPTAKEAQLALEQGRLIKGKKPTLLKGSTPDKVLTTDQQLKSSLTIKKLIPDSASLDEAQLFNSLDEKVAEIATNIKPELQKVKIDKSTLDKLNTDWESLKTSQNSSPYTPSSVNVKKLQADFQNRLSNLKTGTLNDLWEAIKAYDNSVPDSVKKANELSSEGLQAQKDIWLQNRRLLRNVFETSNSTATGEIKSAFSDMRDLYEAQNGIRTKAKIETKYTPSKFSSYIERQAKKLPLIRRVI